MQRTLVALVAASFALAAPAHADDAGYLRELNDLGVPAGLTGNAGADWSPANELAAGRFACDNLRAGWTPEMIVQHQYTPRGIPFPDIAANGRGIVQAAQDQLCPDTKH
jgi:hypothetical protein